MNADQALLRSVQQMPTADNLIRSSPVASALGGRVVEVDAASGKVAIAFSPGDFFKQEEQVIQGGAVAMMLDFAMAFAALAVLPDGQTVATVNLNVSYLRATKGGALRAIGEVERKGKSLIFTRATLVQEDGVLVATASSTLTVLVRQASASA